MTDLKRKRGLGKLEEISQRTHIHSVEPMNTDKNIVEAGVPGAGWRKTKVMEWGKSLIVSTIKNKTTTKKPTKNIEFVDAPEK